MMPEKQLSGPVNNRAAAPRLKHTNRPAILPDVSAGAIWVKFVMGIRFNQKECYRLWPEYVITI